MANRELKVYQEQMAALKLEIRRDGWNRGIRAAARLAGNCWVVGTEHREQAEETGKAILKLIKPPLKEGRYGMLAVKR
jgi:hypothetical protein